MTEFGHYYGSIGGMHIDAWGAGPFEIVVGERRFRFEDSDRFGPIKVNKNGDPAAVGFGERSSFWEAHRLWVAQGRRVEDGICKWRAPLPTIVQKIGNMHVVLQHGEPNAHGGVVHVQVQAPKRPKS